MRIVSLLLVAAAAVLSLPPTAAAQDSGAVRGSSQSPPPEVAGLLDPFSGGPDSSDVARSLDELAIQSHFPRTDEDRILIARLWRRADEPRLALAALDAIKGGARAIVHLERARVLLESDSDRVAGVREYWAVCEATDSLARAAIEWDLLTVSTPDERERWERQASEPAGEEQSCEWLRDFWAERAVRMAISTDERVALHYRRLAHAREWYWIPRPRFQPGSTDYRGRPAALAMDDRGLFYVRMGPPETMMRISGPSQLMLPGQVAGTATLLFPDLSEGDAVAPATSCWPYPRSDGYRIFCFKYGRIAPVTAVPGTYFFHKYVVNLNLPRAAIQDFVQQRLHRLAAWMTPGWVRGLNRVESRAMQRKNAVRTRANVADALQGIPDVPRLRRDVRLRFEPLRFLNPSGGEWHVWLLASARAGDLTPSSDREGDVLDEPAAAAAHADSVATLDLRGRVATRTDAGVAIKRLSPATVPVADVNDDAGITLRGVLTAEPGPLPLTLVVEDLNAPGAGAWIQDTINVPAIGGLPQLSDIAVAQETGGTWTRNGVTFLQVSPAHVTNPDGSIHTYFEVYGVRPGTEYDVEMRLAPEDEAERIWRLEPGDLAFRLRFTAEMPDGGSRIGRHHLRLDLADTEPGEYTLGVRIQDAETEAYSLPAVTPIFVAEW